MSASSTSSLEIAWLASIVEHSDDAIVSKDLDGIITTWNKGAERIFGYLSEEVIGKPITILIPPGREHDADVIAERLRGGAHIDHFESVRRRKDGHLIHVSLTISPVRDVNGKLVGSSLIARDITSARSARNESNS
jgi:PAS domain S-box-containing protein